MKKEKISFKAIFKRFGHKKCRDSECISVFYFKFANTKTLYIMYKEKKFSGCWLCC